MRVSSSNSILQMHLNVQCTHYFPVSFCFKDLRDSVVVERSAVGPGPPAVSQDSLPHS